MKHDAMLMVRADIMNRIDCLAAQSSHLKLPALCEQVDSIRHIARTYGLEPVERIASTLESALSMQGHGAVILSYLDLMRDAAECEQVGPEVSSAYLAALSLRVGVHPG